MLKSFFRSSLVGATFYLASSAAFMQSAHSTDNAPVIDPASFYSNFKDVKLIDQNNQPFQIASSINKVTLYHFIFTNCSAVCPVQTKQLSQVQRLLSAKSRKQVQFVSVSLDPLSDKPASLKQFANRYGADLSNWSFVTGDSAGIARLADTLMLYGNKQQTSQKNIKRPDGHSNYFWLINRQGILMQRYDGMGTDANRIVQEIESLASLHL